MTSLKSTYGEKEERCAELIKENVEIIHVHGKLDELSWESKNGRPYGYKPTTIDELKNSANGIQIIHEKIEKKSFQKAHKLIENSEIIIFLGLNLNNQINLDRLNIQDNLDDKRIYATRNDTKIPTIKRSFFSSL